MAAGGPVSALRETATWLTDGGHWGGGEGIAHRLLEHVGLTVVAVGLAALVAVPLGLWLGHIRRGGTLAINVSNVGRAVPTFAVLVLLAVGPLGIGNTATVVALVLFALPPLLVNAYVGVSEVDRDITESARGMGLSSGQILRSVELPLAAPLLMTGLRIATVQVIATATIAALIGGGGLGRFVVDGFAQHDTGQLVGGALLVALLALAVEALLAVLQRRVDPVRAADRRTPPARTGAPAVQVTSRERP